MVQSAVTTANRMQSYSVAVEKKYCEEIVEQIESGQNLFQEQIQLKLLETQQKQLDDQAARAGLDDSNKTKIERDVFNNIWRYLQEAIESCEHAWTTEQAWTTKQANLLAKKQKELGLKPETAETLNQSIWLEAHDRELFQALLKEDFSLSADYQALKERQAQLTDGLKIKVPLMPPVSLKSQHPINYIRLWRRLQAQNWRKANQETMQRLIEAGGQQAQERKLIDIERIPLVDLQTVDSLWREYSAQKFGFSIQRAIWQTIPASDLAQSELFGRAVGWRRINSWIGYEFIDFSLQAERGHLPVFPHVGWWCWSGRMAAMMSKIAQLP